LLRCYCCAAIAALLLLRCYCCAAIAALLLLPVFSFLTEELIGGDDTFRNDRNTPSHWKIKIERDLTRSVE
jgi:hypothetical protein